MTYWFASHPLAYDDWDWLLARGGAVDLPRGAPGKMSVQTQGIRLHRPVSGQFDWAEDS